MKLLSRHLVSFTATSALKLPSHNHRVPFTATLKTSHHMVRNGVSFNVNAHNAIAASATGDLQSHLERGLMASEKEVEEALGVWKAMTEKGLSPDASTYRSLILGLCLQRRLAEALDFFQEVLREGVLLDKHTCSYLMDAFCLEGEFSKAFHMHDQMKKNGFLPDLVSEFSPSLVTYNALIHGYCCLGRVDDAVGILRSMPEVGLSPDVVSYSTLISGFCRIKEMRKAYDMKLELDDNVCGPDEVTHLLLMQGLSDEDTYTSLMNAYLDEGELDKVATFHDEMTHNGILPSSVIYSVIFNGIISRPRETRKYLLSWISHSWFPTLLYLTHDTLIEKCSANEFESLVGLVHGFCRRGLENAYDTMLQWNYKPDGAVYNLFILEHCKFCIVDAAFNTYVEMMHYGFACHMYSVIALIGALSSSRMYKELSWVIQNVSRSCNLNDSELHKILNVMGVRRHEFEDALSNVLAEKAKDGLLLNGGKSSYTPIFGLAS